MRFVTAHRSAVEYDLLTLTGHVLEDLGRSLPWRALRSFLEHLPMDSAVVREAYPDYAPWTAAIKTNAILADLVDSVRQLNANLVAKGTGRRASRVKPYPRPGKQKHVQQIGRGAMKHSDLLEWFEEKRRSHGR